MRLVKYRHSCVRFETGEGALVIDPGIFSGTEPLQDADAVLITHLHVDHLNEEALRDLRARRPDLALYGPPSLSGALADMPFTAVRNGDVISALGTVIRVYGEQHALIHPSLPATENVGYYLDGLFHPGDAFTVPDAPVRTLLAPVAAAWLKVSEVVDYLKAVGATTVHPIHDAILSAEGAVLIDRVLRSLIDTEYARLDTGDVLEL
jgi:L-ascorbate metabolism protein UlaG (beta-lactamase superfamily)